MQTNQRRALLIEDDPDVQEVFAAMLEDLEYEVLRTTDCDEGLSRLEAEGAELVVLDAGTAAEAADRLRRGLERLGIPLIVTSGAPQSDSRFDGIPHLFLAKPFRPHQLEAAIRAVSARRRPG